MADTESLHAVHTICDRLTERSASLFLGAGINAGIKNNDGIAFPLGVSLGQLICERLLERPGLSLPLDEAAEIARHRMGARALRRYPKTVFRSLMRRYHSSAESS